MKKLWILFLGLILLSGCTMGAGEESSAAAPTVPPSSAAGWGIADFDALSDNPQMASSLEAASSVEPQEDSSLEENRPSSLPQSLREVLPGSIPVWVDGREFSGILEDGVTLLSATELAEAWSWFSGHGDGETWTFSGQADFPHELSCTSPEEFDGEGGICFTGITEEYWLPARWLQDELGVNLLWDGDQNAVYLSAPIRTRDIPQGVQVPTLMYHAVSDNLWGIEELFVSPSELEQQLSYLLEEGYEPIFFSDLPNLSDYENPILLTFDDGYDDNYTELLPLLEEYNVKATVFVITGLVGTEHYLTAEQVKALSDSGLVEIQSHTVNHNELPTLSREDQEYELTQSRLDLARITRKIPSVLCYPSGERSDTTVELTQTYYDFGVDMNGGLWTIQDNLYRIPRIYISRYDTLSSFTAKVP